MVREKQYKRVHSYKHIYAVYFVWDIDGNRARGVDPIIVKAWSPIEAWDRAVAKCLGIRKKLFSIFICDDEIRVINKVESEMWDLSIFAPERVDKREF